MKTATEPTAGVTSMVRVDHEYDVADVISAAMRLCRTLGSDAVYAAHVATAASELANNLWMHASQGGEIRLSSLIRDGRAGIELVAEDDGPGIADLELALTEGYSTAGGMGCGLTGVQRLMDDFSIDSRPGQGTRVVARKWIRARH